MENRRSPFTSDPSTVTSHEQIKESRRDVPQKRPQERILLRPAYWEGDPVPVVFHSYKGWHPTDEPYDGGYY